MAGEEKAVGAGWLCIRSLEDGRFLKGIWEGWVVVGIARHLRYNDVLIVAVNEYLEIGYREPRYGSWSG